MPYRPALGKLRRLTARANVMKTALDEAEASRAYGEREAVRMAYFQSPAGREMEIHFASLCRQWLSALYDEKHPELQTHDPCPRCGSRASPHICGPHFPAEELAANMDQALEEAQRQAEEWAANGAPGAPAWYGDGSRKYWQK